MKTKIVLMLSFVFVSSLISCKNDSDSSEVADSKGTSSIQIDGEVQNIDDASGFLESKSYTIDSYSGEGLRLNTSIGLEDNTGVFLSFHNDDLNATNVVLGDYLTNLDTAFSAEEIKYVTVVVSGTAGYFTSLGTSTDKVTLIKCDLATNKISGEFDTILTNKENNETIRIVGSFTDLSLVVSL